MDKIKQLPLEVANQIAAGEVVEGPASVIKELVENSVDAGADKVSIVVENSGKTFISVTDNGRGVEKNQLPLLIQRHCTSKLRLISDLHIISSMGFRGEALASISSVSRFRVRTKVASDDHGWQLACEGDSSEDVAITPYQQPLSVGTTIEVRDIFFRVPARQKFLSSDLTEMRKIKDVVKRMILAHPSVSFTLSSGEKLVMQAQACETLSESSDRLKVVFGQDFIDSAFFIDQSAPWGRLTGWCAWPSFNRRYADMQVFLLNHRPIRDKKLSFAVKRAYNDVMLPGRHPAFCLYLQFDPEGVDINVHPSKEEVRFSHIDEVTRSLKYFVEQALRESQQSNTDRVDLSDRVSKEVPMSFASSSPDSLPSVSSVSSLDRLSSISSVSDHQFASQPSTQTEVDFKQESLASHRALDEGVVNDSQGHSADDVAYSASTFSQDSLVSGLAKKHFSAVDPTFEVARQPSVTESVVAEPENITDQSSSLGFALGQLHGVYILAQNKQGLVVVDMHAAHERIVYERLKSDYAAQGVVAQKLLVPYRCNPVDVCPDIVEQYGVLLSQMGLELHVVDGQAYLHSLPALLSKENLDGLLQSVIGELIHYQSSDHIQSSLHAIFATMACHSAIRANRRLSIVEMNALLRQIEKTANSDYCNHGRPTWFVWELDKLDAVFRRGQ